MENLKKLIREVPDFPKEGINFYDITTLLKDADGLKQTIDRGRIARLYFRRAARLSFGRGICAGSQTEEAARGKGFRLIRLGIRNGHARNAQRCRRRRSPSADC